MTVRPGVVTSTVERTSAKLAEPFPTVKMTSERLADAFPTVTLGTLCFELDTSRCSSHGG